MFDSKTLAKNPSLPTEHRILLRLTRSLRDRPLWQVRAVERLVAELDRANDSWKPIKK